MEFRTYIDIFLMLIPLALGVYLVIWHMRNIPKVRQENQDPQIAKKLIRRSMIGDVLLFLFVTALVVWGLLTCITQVEGSSMDHSLYDGQRLVGLRTAYNQDLQVRRGDIVVVNSDSMGKMIIKRAVGVPGDEIRIADNQVYVNGELLDEDYIAEPMQTEDGLWILGEDMYFLMGDNRNVSADSRRIGPVTKEEVYAVMVFDLSSFRKIERPAVYDALTP